MTSGSQESGCVLCRARERAADVESLVVHVATHNFIVMNLYPYTSGHVMIATHRHVGRLTDATPDEVTEMMGLARKAEEVLQQVYKPEGMNIGMNIGKPAGAGVAGHIHLHVVPRWIGDTNFMTVVGETRVIPEDPVQACARLKPYFA